MPETDPTVSRNRGRPTPGDRQRGRSKSPAGRGGGRPPLGRGASSEDAEEEPDDIDEDTPLVEGEGGEGIAGNASKKATTGPSKLWLEDDSERNKAFTKRLQQLRPNPPGVKRPTFIIQQQVIRGIAILIFGYVLASFQILCVYQNQCFDVHDDPANWWLWDKLQVPYLFIIGFVIVPSTLYMNRLTNLNALKLMAFMQLFCAVWLNINGGLAYGEWDSENSLRGKTRENVRTWDYTQDWAYDNQRLPNEALFYYNIDTTTEGIADGKFADEMVSRLRTRMLTMLMINIFGGVVFLIQFAFSISYFFHVYYGPKAEASK